MYQINEIEPWREHRSDLLREAEEGQLARRLRSARPNGWSGSAALLGFLAVLMVASLMLIARPARADIIQRTLQGDLRGARSGSHQRQDEHRALRFL
jgi:hypothetical protein